MMMIRSFSDYLYLVSCSSALQLLMLIHKTFRIIDEDPDLWSSQNFLLGCFYSLSDFCSYNG